MPVSRAARAVGLVASCLAAVAMLAACGGGAGTPAASGTPSGGAVGIQAYLACLTQHGVTLPSEATRPRPSFSFTPGARSSRSPGSGGFGGGSGGRGFGLTDPNNPPAGVDAATWSAALTACRSLQPTFTGRGNGGFNNSAFTAYRNCLSDHGLTFSAGPSGLTFDTTDPTVAAALKACAPLRPTGRPTASPSPTT
jgi:hypothetical protein